MTDKLDLKALRALCDDATQGPWTSHETEYSVTVREKYGYYMAIINGDSSENKLANARFISTSRQIIPALLDEVERLRGATEKLNDIYFADLIEDFCIGNGGVCLLSEVQDVETMIIQRIKDALKGQDDE